MAAPGEAYGAVFRKPMHVVASLGGAGLERGSKIYLTMWEAVEEVG